MKTKNLFLSAITVLLMAFGLNAQNAENPWAISVGIDLISLQGENTDSGVKIGAPALSLSRYLGAGFSIGGQYVLGKSANNGVDLDYLSMDGIIKYNLGAGKLNPYLFGGYGLTNFSDNDNDEGQFPSTESSRTVLGGIGINVPIGDNLNINASASYRSSNESGTYNHLQHVIGLNYTFGTGDRDKDGVSDKKDECPDIPGLKEFNGCPDTDGDGIPDNKDACPEEAGPESLKGCPDNDGDGIPNSEDACPDDAGSAEMNGCPDSDGDGVADNEDNCPDTAGDKENNGCPWADADGDGVPDKDDSCPDVAGDAANNGCPEVPKSLVEFLESDQSKILFTASSSNINNGGKASLDKLKEMLDMYPNAAVTISGHASSDGSTAYNQKLSEQRAASVKAYLVSKGVDASRIDTVGYGESKPVQSNKTRKGRAMNRRAEINRRAEVSVN